MPRERFGVGAIALAIATHTLLLALLFFGLRWQNQEPVVMQAELWSAVPQSAAPAPPPPEPEVPAAAKKVEPIAKPAPTPIKPDIALKQEKAIKKPPPKVVKPEPKPEPKVAAKVPPKAVPKQEANPAPAPAPVEAPPQPAAQSDMNRLMAQANSPGAGSAPQTSGSKGDPDYSNGIRAKILANLRFPVPGDLAGNSEAIFVVEQLPSGEIKSVIKRKARGLSAFDQAVERAINASSPLPKGRDGRVERSLELVFKPTDKR